MLQFDFNYAYGTRGGRTDPKVSYKPPSSFEVSHSLHSRGLGGRIPFLEATSASPDGSKEFGDSRFSSASTSYPHPKAQSLTHSLRGSCLFHRRLA